MAAFQFEQAICTGRGFDAAGLLGKFKTFIPKVPSAGGPGWYVHDDQSALGTDPYIVVSSHNAAGPEVVAKYIQVLLPTATSGQIRAYYFLYWNPTTHIGFGMYGAFAVPTLDAADFIYDFRGGPECMFLQTFTTTQWDGTWIDEFTPDPNLLDSVSATTAVTNFTNTTPSDIQFRGCDISGPSGAVDANGNTYFSIILVSGTTYRIDQFNDAAKTVLVARSTTFTGLVAAANTNTIALSAQGGSGVTTNAFIQGPTIADATILFRVNKITVGSGEGAQFIVGNYYFAYDFTLRNSVNSFLVVSKSGDILSVDRLYRPFPLGTKIGSYPHNFVCAGSDSTLMSTKMSVPYYNLLGTCSNYINSSGIAEQTRLVPSTLSTAWGAGNTGPAATLSHDDNYITTMSPDRKGRWVVQRSGVAEYNCFGVNTRNGVTAYGQLKNIIAGAIGSMSPNIHGRTLAGIDYTLFRTLSTYYTRGVTTVWAGMFRETESLS